MHKLFLTKQVGANSQSRLELETRNLPQLRAFHNP